MIKREFERDYIKWYGEDWLKEFKKALKNEYPKYIRVNTLKIGAKELIKRLKEKGFELKKIKGIDYGFKVVEEPFSISSTQEHLLGYFYMQDKASMYPVIELDPKEDDIVLDSCSAPGGKTTHIAQLMNNKGVIVAVDNNRLRLKSQLFNIQRLGIVNVASFHLDATKVKSIGLKYDKILIDAPCSATGTMWKQKRRSKEVNKHKVQMYAELQKRIIQSTYKVLKDKGIMVYSTCSIEREENEENAAFIESNLNLKIKKEKHLFPQNDDTIGFYYVVFKKS